MKLPNGYGSVYKLSGKRRKPWAVKKVTGWNDKGQPKYKYIGYYATKKEALDALAEYNTKGDMVYSADTFKKVFDAYIKDSEYRLSEVTLKNYKSSFQILEPLFEIKMNDLKRFQIQSTINESGRSKIAINKLLIVLKEVFKFAVKNELISTNKLIIVQDLDTSKVEESESVKRQVFTPQEIEYLWKNVRRVVHGDILLILIYTGLRISELLNLKMEDIHLDEKYIFIKESKTEAGIRQVPLNEKIIPLFEDRMLGFREYFMENNRKKNISYSSFHTTYWKKLTAQLQMNHTIHDTRHTCVSLLTHAGVDERVIRSIVGHKGESVTESVYTHIDFETKLEAINKI